MYNNVVYGLDGTPQSYWQWEARQLCCCGRSSAIILIQGGSGLADVPCLQKPVHFAYRNYCA